MKKILCIVLSLIFMLSGLTVAVYAADTDCEHVYENTSVAPTCAENGYTLHVCSKCGDYYKDNVIPAIGHNLGDWKVIREASCSEEGIKECECQRCHSFITETISVLDHVDKNRDGKCDTCEAEVAVEKIFSPFDWLIALFRAIAEWFREIFA